MASAHASRWGHFYSGPIISYFVCLTHIGSNPAALQGRH